MDEMIRYIFRSLTFSEKTIKNIKKTLSLQAKTNKLLTIFVITTTIYMITSEIRRAEQDHKFKMLSKEFAELRHTEGAQKKDA
ncbi:MAG TPA: hypothetical protein GX717_01900 [Clostridiaceae bacterium]|nr:hypothetical protein [Clostridiaceae bacterium]